MITFQNHDLNRENNWALKMAADVAAELEKPLRSAVESNFIYCN